MIRMKVSSKYLNYMIKVNSKRNQKECNILNNKIKIYSKQEIIIVRFKK